MESSLNFKNLHLDLKQRKGFHKVKGFDGNLSAVSSNLPEEQMENSPATAPTCVRLFEKNPSTQVLCQNSQ